MSIQLDSIELPAGLIWADEFSSQSVAQTAKRTLAGGLVVFHSPLTSGRAITLESSEKTGWIKRSVVLQLEQLAADPGRVMPLVIRSNTYSVMFRHDQGVAFEAEPIFPFANPTADDYYIASIRLMTV